MTDLEFRKFVRSLIAEYVGEERFWTDEELELYKQNAISGIIGEYWPHLIEKKKKAVSITIEQGNPYISLPNDLMMVISIIRNSDNEELSYIRSNEISWWQNFTSEPNYGWTFEGDKIRLIPIPTVTRENFITIWYMPKLTQLSDFPEVLHPVIAIDTVIFAKSKDENVSPALLALRESYHQKAVRLLTIEQLQRVGG